MTPQPKLPAYARGLLAQRYAGRHPRAIFMVYGDEWAPDRSAPFRLRDNLFPEAPVLAVSPRQFAPGAFDFRVCAGVLTFVVDRASDAQRCDHEGFEHLLWLHGEIAQAAQPREVWCWSDLYYALGLTDALVPFDDVAFAYRRFGSGRWPAFVPRALGHALDGRYALHRAA